MRLSFIVIAILLLLSANVFAANIMPVDSYFFVTIDDVPPYTDGHVPSKGAINIDKTTSVVVHVKDDGLGVDINTITMVVNGVNVNPDITGTKEDYTLTYNPSVDFKEGNQIFVTVEASDLAD